MRLDTAPKRQSVPIILKIALVLWGTSALVYQTLSNVVSEKWFSDLYIILIIFCFLAIAILLLIILKTKLKTIYCYAIAILFGISISCISANNLNSQMKNITNMNPGEYTFNVEEDQKAGAYYNTCEAIITNTNYKVKLQFDQDFEEIHAGDVIKAQVKYSAPVDTQKQNYWQNGICANAQVSEAEKLQRTDPVGLIFVFRNHLIETIRNYDWNEEGTSEAEQLLNAIICGQRIDLNSSDLYDSFKCSGLAHLVAVSGAHLSLVTAILLIFLKKLKLKKWLIIVIQSCFILAYLICAAIPISALRAAFMAYIALFAFFSKRRPAPLNALGICIIILISLDASTSVSVSFALSAGSTIGIIMFSVLFEYWIAKPFPRCPAWARSALALTFAASICSQPLSISIFNQLPLIAPLANIICTPIFTVLCGFGLVASVFTASLAWLFPMISQGLMFCAYSVSAFMSTIVRILASIPYASIPMTLNIFIALAITLAACLALYFLWPPENAKRFRFFAKKKTAHILIAATAVLIALFIFIPKNFGTELKMLDVGQGDAILLRSGGKSFLIDTGNQDSMLKSRLAENGISHLDGVLITHPDDDHYGSLDEVQRLIVVDKVYVAKDLPSCNEGNCQKLMSQIKKIVSDENIVKLKVGDKIAFGEMELQIVWPDKYQNSGGNSDSLTCVASVDIGNDGEIESRALLCGDAEKEEISAMLKKKRIPKIDIYKCGHHGSANALTESSARALSPKITLISVGAKNRYGHPNANTIAMLEAVGSEIYRTDLQGSITCKFVGSKIEIKLEKT